MEAGSESRLRFERQDDVKITTAAKAKECPSNTKTNRQPTIDPVEDVPVQPVNEEGPLFDLAVTQPVSGATQAANTR